MIKSFHDMTDRQMRGYQINSSGSWAPWPKVTIVDRSLTYQFFPHFQPYVPPLIERLNDVGVSELEDSDTLYLPQPNPPVGQPLQPMGVIPNSTRGVLAQDWGATRADATSVTLTAGTPLTLTDGITVEIAAGTQVLYPDGTAGTLAAKASVALPGQLPVTSSSGIEWNIAGKDTIVPDGTNVTLPAGGQAVLLSDGSSVTLGNSAPVILRSGLPQPYFYEDFFSRYGPDSTHVQHPYPVKDLDFTFDGAYSIYNWELFFHAPLLIAIHLSQNQRFQDAQNWFHYIFNPMDNSPGPTPERFWKVRPFQYDDVTLIEQILVNLSTNQDPALYQETVACINNWKQNPFQPFAIGKYRPTSYMLKTVMAYLDNLIAWGDSLFQQYTIETINEATQIYVMAAHILGPKPQAVPKKGTTKTLTYNDLKSQLDAFSNAMVDMEVDIPFDLAPMPSQGADPQGDQILGSIGQTLYFCIPRNDILLGYWDTVADRLFKIHNSLNLQGVFQELPLYDPPIDPALLVRAAAAGLDVSAIVNGLNQPLPLVRFALLVAKATEICQEVKSLGAGLLAAMEKQDAESLSLLRAQHENAILGLAEMVKYSQWQEAQKATQALQMSLANAAQQYAFYQRLLGNGASDADIRTSVMKLADGLDQSGLQNLKFTQTDAKSEPQMPLDAINPDISQDATSVSDGEIKTLSNHEVEELNKLGLSHDAQVSKTNIETLNSVLSMLPQLEANVLPMGCGATLSFGSQQLHAELSAVGSQYQAQAEQFSYEAGNAGKLGSYSRREVEWTFQSNSAKAEINMILKQLRGAQIREAMTEQEYKNHQKQMSQAQEIVDFLEGTDIGKGFRAKETTIGFYAYLKREVKALYAQSFQLAYEVSKKAERAMQNELGNPSLNFIQFNYLDGTEGLLAGEKLLADLKTMEMAYHDLNQREYEMTKHVSLLQIAPLALVELRVTGACTFTVPEEALDLDIPLYFRRIKSVALTLPCVTGPYTSVNCTLTLQKSSIRTSTDVAEGYARKGSEDPRFNDYFGSVKSVVTSSAQSDSGLFETNLKDERYLPFENAGIAGSQWTLTLPADVRQFDFDTIADVIVHVRYTAREGGEAFKAAATANLQSLINKAQTVGSARLISVRHEFPSDWAKFQSVTLGQAGSPPTAELKLTLAPELYPFWAQNIVPNATLKAVELIAEMLPGDKTVTVNLYDKSDKSGNNDVLTSNPTLGNLLSGNLNKIAVPRAVSDAAHPFTLYFDDNAMEDLWLAITWGR